MKKSLILFVAWRTKEGTNHVRAFRDMGAADAFYGGIDPQTNRKRAMVRAVSDEEARTLVGKAWGS